MIVVGMARRVAHKATRTTEHDLLDDIVHAPWFGAAFKLLHLHTTNFISGRSLPFSLSQLSQYIPHSPESIRFAQ